MGWHSFSSSLFPGKGKSFPSSLFAASGFLMRHPPTLPLQRGTSSPARASRFAALAHFLATVAGLRGAAVFLASLARPPPDVPEWLDALTDADSFIMVSLPVGAGGSPPSPPLPPSSSRRSRACRPTCPSGSRTSPMPTALSWCGHFTWDALFPPLSSYPPVPEWLDALTDADSFIMVRAGAPFKRPLSAF